MKTPSTSLQPWLVLIALILLSFFLPLGMVPLFDLDEGAFSEATREMLVSGDFLTTYLNGELRFDKPILIYWLQAASVSLLGLNEFALRLPSAAASAFWALGIFFFTRRFFSRDAALYATLFMVASLQIALISKAAIADALLNLWLASSLFCIYRYYVTEEKRSLLLAYVFISLGILTKGPVAVVIPVAVTFLFFAWQRDLKNWIKMLFYGRGWLLLLLIALPWYLLEYLEQGQRFIDGFFFKHNLNRFDGPLEGHGGSLLYYIPVLLVGLLPFSMILGNLVRHVRENRNDSLVRFLLVWFGFVFLFFSFSGTKLPHYVIYGYTPLFVLGGVAMAHYPLKRTFLVPPLLLLGLLALLPVLLELDVLPIRDAFAASIIQGGLEEFDSTYFAGLGLLALLLSLGWLKSHSAQNRLLLLAFSYIITINYVVMPVVAAIKQSPIKEAGLLAKQQGWSAAMYKINTPTFLVYYEGLAPRTDDITGYDAVLTKSIYLPKLPPYEILYQKHGIALVKISQE